jgi:hypothetical protein
MVKHLHILQQINTNLCICVKDIKKQHCLPFSRFSGLSSWLHSEKTASHTSTQSLFQTFITEFFQQTVIQSRTSFNFRNQHFRTIHHVERHNGNKFFRLGSCYRKEMALDGAGFTQRKWGNSRQSARTHLFLCVSIEQAVIKRQLCRSWNEICCDFFVTMIK